MKNKRFIFLSHTETTSTPISTIVLATGALVIVVIFSLSSGL